MEVTRSYCQARPTLRLFVREADAHETPLDEISDMDLTLRQIYEKYFIPLHVKPKALSSGTSQIYTDALDKWEALTPNPPISQIDEFTTAEFVAALLSQPGRKGETLAIATVRKHCKQINKLLTFCGPKTPEKHGRKNLRIVSEPPFCDMPDADQEAPYGDFTLEEVRAMFAACHKMTRPNVEGVPPGDWWRALIVVAVCTGLRIGHLMRLEWIDLHPPFITAWARSGKKRKGKRQYLTAEALEELDNIRTVRRRIFEFPGWDNSSRWLHRTFKKLLRHAGIPAERQFGFHGFRKLHSGLVGETSGVQAAQQSLGHASDATTKRHYLPMRVQDKLAAQAIEQMPRLRQPTTDGEAPAAVAQ